MNEVINVLLLEPRKLEAIIPRPEGVNIYMHKLSVMRRMFPVSAAIGDVNRTSFRSPDVNFLHTVEFERYYTMLDIFLMQEIYKITGHKGTEFSRDVGVLIITPHESAKILCIHYIMRYDEQRAIYYMKFLNLIIVSDNIAREFGLLLRNNPGVMSAINLKYKYYLTVLCSFFELNSRNPIPDSPRQVSNLFDQFILRYWLKMAETYDVLLHCDIYHSDLITDMLLHQSTSMKLDHESIYQKILTGRYINTSGYDNLESLIRDYHFERKYSCDELILCLSPKQSPRDLIDCLQIISGICPSITISRDKLEELGKISVIEFAKTKKLYT